MKYHLILRSSFKGSLCFLLCAAGFVRPLRADDISKNLIQQSQADQQDIRNHTAAVVTQVQDLIDELAANGISGDDNKVLQATKAALNNLSGPEMERVIASLQKAGSAADSTTTQQNAVKAYTGQKGIILQFQQILKEYAQRQAAYALPQRFKELSNRQTETMRTTTEVAARTVGQSASELSSMDQTTEQIVQTDQAAIISDVAQAQEQLDKAVQDSAGDEGKNLAQAQQDLKSGKLQQALNQANDDIKAGNLLKAISDQKLARDELRRVTRDLNPASDIVDALTATAGDLAQLIESQKKLSDQTNGSISGKTADSSLVDKQIVLVDKTDLLQQDMQSLSPDAAGIVKGAINPMQVSRFKLHDLVAYPQAVQSQSEAIAKLEEAQKQLQQQVADAQKAEDEANKDPVAKLQDLQKKIQDEIKQQQQIAQQTAQAENAPTPDPANVADAQQKQSQLQDQTSALQKDAQADSLSTSQTLANAAAQMDQAQKDLADPAKGADAKNAQAAALSALNQANKDLDQQIAQAQQTPADPSALAAADAALQKSQDEAGNAQADASPAPPATPDTDAASKALADAGKDAQTAANTPGLPQDAAQDVKNAQAELAKGQQDAGQKNASGAAAHAAAAQQALAQAQAKVASAAAAMAGNAPGNAPGSQKSNQPGPPGPPGRIAGNTTSHSTKIAGGDNKKGTLHDVNGTDKFISLAARERAAIGQSQEEKRPQEYAPMIDQYMKNLADQASAQ